MRVEIHFCSWKHTFARGNTLLRVETHFCSWKYTFARGITLLLVATHLYSWKYTLYSYTYIRIVTQGCFLVLVENRYGIFVPVTCSLKLHLRRLRSRNGLTVCQMTFAALTPYIICSNKRKASMYDVCCITMPLDAFGFDFIK